MAVSTRRRQEDRSAETQARLLAATLACVQEVGMARASTPLICERAGVSRGAMLHHYPSRDDLVRAAIGQAVQGALDQMDADMDALEAGDDPLAVFFESIWATTEGPLFSVALELLVAARTDPGLAPEVAHGSRELHAKVAQRVERIAELLGRQADPQVMAVLWASVYMVRGMALQGLFDPDSGHLKRVFEAWRTVATRLACKQGAAAGD